MTREERRVDAATNYGYAVAGGCLERPIVSNAFLKGAEWADEHPMKGMVSLEDVCEFLDEHLYTGTSTDDYDFGQEYICSDFDNATDLIFALRKAMGE